MCRCWRVVLGLWVRYTLILMVWAFVPLGTKVWHMCAKSFVTTLSILTNYLTRRVPLHLRVVSSKYIIFPTLRVFSKVYQHRSRWQCVVWYLTCLLKKLHLHNNNCYEKHVSCTCGLLSLLKLSPMSSSICLVVLSY